MYQENARHQSTNIHIICIDVINRDTVTGSIEENKSLLVPDFQTIILMASIIASFCVDFFFS